jgi:hypothetical protein
MNLWKRLVTGLQQWLLSQPEHHEERFQRLPLELISHIMHFLPPESCAALSLVSKAFYWCCSQSLRISDTLADPTAKRRFLLLIERDQPQLLLCAYCNMLYKWRKHYRFGCARTHPKRYLSLISLCYTHMPYLCRNVQDLILRCDESGPAYGLPVTYLEHSCNGYHDDPTILKRIVPKIIRKQLFIWKSCELLINLRGDETVLKQLEKLDKIHFCEHSYRHIPPIALCAVSHVVCGHSVSESEMKCTRLIKCARCATDMKVAAEEVSGYVRVKIDAWQNYGGRDYPLQGLQNGMFESRPPLNTEDALRRNIRTQFLGLEESSSSSAPTGIILHHWNWYPRRARIVVSSMPDGVIRDLSFAGLTFSRNRLVAATGCD